eukprot:m.89698 g.89698  ORF g.89698 m.89698 type:complete len:55 (-) comp26324_c0_seq1:908-1072(-)
MCESVCVCAHACVCCGCARVFILPLSGSSCAFGVEVMCVGLLEQVLDVEPADMA